MKRQAKLLGGFLAITVVGLLAACSGGTSGLLGTASKMATAQKIAKLEKEIDLKQQEANALLALYVKQGGDDVAQLVGQNMTPDQTKLLEAKLRNEEGVGYRDLLSDILSKERAIEDLRVQVQDLEKTLPAPVEVVSGQRHFDIAMSYLIQDKHLDPATAEKLVHQVNLMDDLRPGFRVWNFYDDGVYGTFVTQGSAPVSPYGVIQRDRSELVHARDAAIEARDALAKERSTLKSEVADLTSQKEKLSQDVTLLTSERDTLTVKVGELQTLSEDLAAQNNSVYYRIGLRKALISEGAVRDPWYGQPMLAKYDTASYPQRYDLRSGDTLVFSASQANVARIKRVKLAPGALYKSGRDYIATISADGTQCAIRLLDKDKFRSERSIMILVN